MEEGRKKVFVALFNYVLVFVCVDSSSFEYSIFIYKV